MGKPLEAAPVDEAGRNEPIGLARTGAAAATSPLCPPPITTASYTRLWAVLLGVDISSDTHRGAVGV